MKNISRLIALIIVTLISSKANSQYYQSARLGSNNIVGDIGAIRATNGGIISTLYVDTTSANSKPIKRYHGSIIQTLSPVNTFWIRDTIATVWLKIGRETLDQTTSLGNTSSNNIFIRGTKYGASGTSTTSQPNIIAIGDQSLNVNTGATNLAIGRQSLFSNTTGFSGTVLGHFAMSSNTTGQYNTAIGEGAIQVNQTGSRNTAVGWASMLDAVNPSFNTLVGWYAGRKAGGTYNTGVGYSVFGAAAGATAITGTHNTLLGADATLLNPTTTHGLGLGYGAQPGNNQAAFDPSISSIKAPGFTTSPGMVLTDLNGNGIWTMQALPTDSIYTGEIIKSMSAETTVTVSIGTTISPTNYRVSVTPTSSVANSLFYVTNKTATTFDVVFLSAITGSLTMDWILIP